MDFIFSIVDTIDESLNTESKIEISNDFDYVFECDDLMSVMEEESVTEAVNPASIINNTIKVLDTVLKRIIEFYQKAKTYIKEKLEVGMHGSIYDNKSTHVGAESILVLKSFDYNKGIKELYQSLTPLVNGFSNYTKTIQGIDFDKYVALTIKDSHTAPIHALEKEFNDILEEQTASVCSNGDYTNEELNNVIKKVKFSFFGNSDEKVSIKEYKGNEVPNIQKDRDQLLKNLDLLKKDSEKTIKEMMDVVKTFNRKLSRAIAEFNRVGRMETNLLHVAKNMYNKAVNKVTQAMQVETAVINGLVNVYAHAYKEQNRINVALTQVETHKDNKDNNNRNQNSNNSNQKQLPSGKMESVEYDDEGVDFLFECIGVQFDTVMEATGADRLTMIGKRVQIICQKIMMLVNKIVTDMMRVAEKLIVEYVNICSTGDLKRIFNAKDDKSANGRAAIVYVPSMKLQSTMSIINDTLENVLKNLEDFASVDINSDGVMEKLADVTPLEMILKDTGFTSINKMMEDVKEKSKSSFNPTEVNMEIFNSLKYVDKSELTASIKIIKSVETLTRKRINAVMKNIMGASRQKDLSDRGYNYCVRLISACSAAYSVLSQGLSQMNTAFLKANAYYQLLPKLVKKNKEEATTESFDYLEYRRNMIKRQRNIIE